MRKEIKESERIKNFKDKYLAKILNLYSPKKVIIFGSIAHGENIKESDIDLIIVSNKFKGINFLERIEKVLLEVDFDEPVDVLCYTEEEFNVKKEQLGIVNRAVKGGIVIYG